MYRKLYERIKAFGNKLTKHSGYNLNVSKRDNLLSEISDPQTRQEVKLQQKALLMEKQLNDLVNYSMQDAVPPNENELKDLTSRIAMYIAGHNALLNDKQEVSEDVKICLDFLNGFTEMFPDLANHIDGCKNIISRCLVNYAKKQISELSKGFNNKTKDNFKALKSLVSLGISESYYERGYDMQLMVNHKYRQHEYDVACEIIDFYNERGEVPEGYFVENAIKPGTDVETIYKRALNTAVKCAYINEQYERMKVYGRNKTAEKTETSYFLSNGYDTKLTGLFDGGSVPPNDVDSYAAILSDVIKSDKVSRMLSQNIETLKERFKGNKAEDLFKENIRILVSGEPDIIKSADHKIINTLTDNFGDKRSGNSNSYNAMADAIDNFAKSANRAGGVSLEDYRSVYNNLRQYVYSHNSKPVTGKGRARFDSAAKMMADIGLMLGEKDPSMKDKIEKDFRVNMLRSRAFREHLNTKLSAGMLENNSFAKEMKSDLEMANSKLSAAKTEMITGILDTPEKRNQLLEKFAFVPKPRIKKSIEFNNIIADISTLSKKEVVGGQLSERQKLTLQLEDGNVVKGFFTNSSTTDLSEKYNNYFNEAASVAQKYKTDSVSSEKIELFKSFCERLKEVPRFSLSGAVSDATGVTEIKNLKDMFSVAPKKKFKNLTQILSNTIAKEANKDVSFDEFNRLFENISPKEVQSFVVPALTEFLTGLCNINSIELTNLRAGIEKGGNINRRNNGMYEMSKLFGLDNLICKSVNMSVIKDGVQTEGSFMVNAKGVGIDTIDAGIEHNGKLLPLVITPQAKRDFGRLQIMDYLCANIDRHLGNFFYDVKYVEGTEGGHLELTGLQGIDNDLSFGNISGQEERNISKMSVLANITFIDRDLADSIVEMKASDFEKTLRGMGLGKEEISAGISRLTGLQEKIISGKIETKDSLEDWKAVDFSAASRDSKDIWHMAAGIQRRYGNSEEKKRMTVDELKDLGSSKGKEIFRAKNIDSNAQLKAQHQQLKELAEKMDKVCGKTPESFYFIDKQLNTIVSRMDSMLNNKDKTVGDMELNHLSEAFGNLNRSIKNYLKNNAGNEKGLSKEAAEQRVHLAKNLNVALEKGEHAIQEEINNSYLRMKEGLINNREAVEKMHGIKNPEKENPVIEAPRLH